MKTINQIRTLMIVPAMLMCGVMAGCQPPPHDMSKQTAPYIGSPLKGVASQKLIFKTFSDSRGQKPDVVGALAHPYVVRTTPNVNQIVEQAIKGEFQHNGHVCLAPAESQAGDYVVEGVVYQYWANMEAGKRWVANVGVKLTFVQCNHPDKVYTKKYEGSHHADFPILYSYSRKDPIKVLSEATLNMLKELAADHDLIEFMKNPAR
jgi:uncharacterized lipoprotein YajG